MATVKLPFIRFVKRVSNGASLSKYGYIGMMDQNADLIQSAPWVLAQSPNSVTLTTNQLTKTDGIFDSTTGAWTTQPTYTAYMADTYDCFKQAGDAVARNATMCGYAGCVAYRFKLPTSETANALNSISLALQRDRYSHRPLVGFLRPKMGWPHFVHHIPHAHGLDPTCRPRHPLLFRHGRLPQDL